MGCANTKAATPAEGKIVPRTVRDTICISPASLTAEIETFSRRRRISIEIIHHESIVADSQVNHLGQMNAAPKGSAIEGMEEGQSLISDSNSGTPRAKKSSKSPATMSEANKTDKMPKVNIVREPKLTAKQKEAARYSHVISRYDSYEFDRKAGDGSLGEVIVLKHKKTRDEITVYV